jgi:required for meiotic nuclear division protein 1
MTAVLQSRNFQARALLVGHRLDLRRLQQVQPLATTPLTLEVAGGGLAVLFRFGAVVFFDVKPMQEAAFLEDLAPFVAEPLVQPETEALDVVVDPARPEGLDQTGLAVPEADLPRLQVVADILAKSVLLAVQEARVASAFDRIEPLAEQLQRRGRGTRSNQELTRYIGEMLLIQHRTVGRAEVGDKPDILWERTDLERLFQRLDAEYELGERRQALQLKLELIGDTAQTLLDLLQNRRSLRVEWYIVILIVVEIALTLYELFFRVQ